MATISSNAHPVVGDRVIEGIGTSVAQWQRWQGLAALPPLAVETILNAGKRVCVFAPHPDDEILGCGGLLQQLAARDMSILVIHVTNGTQSHPNSTLYPPQKLNTLRPQESLRALEALGVKHLVRTLELNLPDGDMVSHQVDLREKIAAIVQSDDVLITPFARDGHPDHEMTGQVVAKYAKEHGLACLQVLIWAWHWAQPNDKRIPWQQASRLDLSQSQLARKKNAIHCFSSQITADESTGSPPVLTAETINRIIQLPEVYLYEQTV